MYCIVIYELVLKGHLNRSLADIIAIKYDYCCGTN